MDFRLLGPVEVWSDGQQIRFSRKQERLLLAVLLLEAGRVVRTETLIDYFWPSAPPAEPQTALRVYASRLRATLATAGGEQPEVMSGADGYRITVPPGSTDVGRFTCLIEQAGTTDDLTRRTTLLTEALGLWRGQPLADVGTDDLRHRLCIGLTEAHQTAIAALHEARLELGDHEAIVDELQDRHLESPGDERAARATMLALYRCGRPQEALAVYAACLAELSDRLGLDPSQELAALGRAIEENDPALQWGAALDSADVPRELPADVALLVGRESVLREATATPTGLTCFFGGAGMGKTALAVRLGHLTATSFPNGQAFARLQTPDGARVPVRVVAARLLRSLGVPGDAIPDDEDERTAMLRSTLADRAVLVVLDDVVDAAQIRPLISDGPRCGAVVTSRRRLDGFESARHFELTALEQTVGLRLLTTLAGTGQASETLTEIARHCAGVPLALRIVGLQLGFSQGAGAERLAAALGDETRRLDSLVAGDLAVRRSLEVAHAAVDGEAQRLFARLSLVHVDEFSAWVAAPLLDCDEETAERAVGRLVEFGMLQVRRNPPNPRYGMHGLLRAYAGELQAETPSEEAELGYLRALLHLVSLADDQLGHGMRAADGLSGLGDPDLPTAAANAAAPGWLDLEAGATVEAVNRAAKLGQPELAAVLTLRINGYLAVRNYSESRVGVLEAARQALAGTGREDLSGRVEMAICGAMAQQNGLHVDVLIQQAERAVEATRASGNPAIEALARSYLGTFTHWAGNLERAMEISQDNLARIRHLGPEDTLSTAVHGLAGVLLDIGDAEGAAQLYQEAAALSVDTPRRHAITLSGYSGALAMLGRLDEMAEVLMRANQIVTELGDELGTVHVDIGRARLAMLRGETAEAERLLVAAEERLAKQPEISGSQRIHLLRAELELAAGRRESARRVLETAVAEAEADGYHVGVHRCRRLLDSDDYSIPN